MWREVPHTGTKTSVASHYRTITRGSTGRLFPSGPGFAGLAFGDAGEQDRGLADAV